MLLPLLWGLSSGCENTADKPAAAILGRWQRVSQAGPGDPNEVSSEYIEFRETGLLLSLIREEVTGVFWQTNTATYTLPTTSQLQVTGSCWRGWERYTCTRVYGMQLNGDRLGITGDGPAEYRRIATLSPNAPPTLAPPFPSPTPAP